MSIDPREDPPKNVVLVNDLGAKRKDPGRLDDLPLIDHDATSLRIVSATLIRQRVTTRPPLMAGSKSA